MSRRRNIRTEEDKTDINISPMIDMVFILLIFFIVTTVFVEERGIDADRPTPAPMTEMDNPNPPIKMTLRENGVIMYEGEEISLSSVRNRVEQRLQSVATDKPAVIIEAEPNVPAGRMIQVIDEATIAGASKVNIMQATR